MLTFEKKADYELLRNALSVTEPGSGLRREEYLEGSQRSVSCRHTDHQFSAR